MQPVFVYREAAFVYAAPKKVQADLLRRGWKRAKGFSSGREEHKERPQKKQVSVELGLSFGAFLYMMNLNVSS
jgi:hypothetical protein